MTLSGSSSLTSGTVLYDWIRKQALIHPPFNIRCTGVHFETPTRSETVQDENGLRQRRAGQPERIVDFDFTVDLMPVFAHPENFANVHISLVRPDLPTHRGTPYPTYAGDFAPTERASSADYTSLQGPMDAGRVAYRNEMALLREWATWRNEHGLPVWTDMKTTSAFWDSRGSGKGVALPETDADTGTEETRIGRQASISEASLRAWCDRYAADPALLKEFDVYKNAWGWDVDGLKAAIKSAIISTGYNSNHLTVEIEPKTSAVVVLPRNLLSRMINTVSMIVVLRCHCISLTSALRLRPTVDSHALPLHLDLAALILIRRRTLPRSSYQLRLQILPSSALNLPQRDY